MDQSTKKKKCVVQCRVSSLKQSHEGESLDDQETSLRRFVESRDIGIVPNNKVWRSALSGRKTHRDDFEEILAYIKAHPGEVDYYVFKCIDRATRAGIGEYDRMKVELAKCGVEMLDLNGVIQPSKNTLEDLGFEYSWSRYSPSEITENVLATNAKQEVTNILTRMMRQEIRLTQQGYRTRRPADGYTNTKIYVEGKKKTIQIPDPERAKYFIAMFELSAQLLPHTEVVERVNAMGYRSQIQNKWNKDHTKIIGRTGGVLLTVKQLQRHIKNTIYAGVLCEKWTHFKPVRAQYPGLVNIEIFNRANKGERIIKENDDGSLDFAKSSFSKTGKIRNKFNELFPYKFVTCSVCGKPFLGSSSKSKSGKRVPYYHCSRKHARVGVPKDILEEHFESYIQNLKFKPEILNALELTFLNKYREREKEIVTASGDIHQNIADLKLEQASKLEALVASRSSVVKEKLEQEIEDLELKIKDARKQRLKIEVTESDIKSFVREAKKIMEHPTKILLNPTDLKVQRTLFGLVFEQMPTYEEILNGTPKLSWIFELSSDFKPTTNQLVSVQKIELSWFLTPQSLFVSF